MSNAQPKEAFTLAEAAALIGVRPRYLAPFIRSGELRVARLGHRTLRISREALRDFLKAREQATERRG